MREYLFRGKRKDRPTEWVCGYYLQFYYEVPNGDYTENKFGHFILPLKQPDFTAPHEEDLYCEIIPETLGQLLPIKDAFGNKLFEGDIVRGKRTPDRYSSAFPMIEGYYEYKEVRFEITETRVQFSLPKDITYAERHAENEIKWVLWGNTTDNPELLK